MTDLKKLRELAAMATFPSSEWDSEHPASDEWKANKENNLAWCRAANPQAIIEILDMVDRYREALRFYAGERNLGDCEGSRWNGDEFFNEDKFGTTYDIREPWKRAREVLEGGK